ncbi:MAG TPA: hypothetical protein VFF43_06440, partial [Caldimonas sp.]|nr:hypothetical protein [Caldimonas sp.]
MSIRRLLPALGAVAAVGCASPLAAHAHGFAGKRFFPATLATDDPFVADELSLPTVQYRRTVDDSGASSKDTVTSIELAKRITPQLGVGFGATWLNLRPEGAPRASGFDNFAASAKYQLLVDEPHETIVSIGVDWDIGRSGATRVGAERFSTLTPAVFVGKGLGDLPESMKFWRPIALTGSLGVGFPTSSSTTTLDDDGNAVTEQHPHVLQAGFAIEYSLPYLNAFVKDVGLPSWLRGAVPLVEVALSKPLDRGGGPTIGTVNPGILFAGRTMQFGIEAVVPINKRTGGGTGVLLQLHFFLDDLFPH